MSEIINIKDESIHFIRKLISYKMDNIYYLLLDEDNKLKGVFYENMYEIDKIITLLKSLEKKAEDENLKNYIRKEKLSDLALERERCKNAISALQDYMEDSDKRPYYENCSKGYMTGKRQVKIEVALNMLKDKEENSIEDISYYTELSKEEIEEIIFIKNLIINKI
jgi:hypothetical protein